MNLRKVHDIDSEIVRLFRLMIAGGKILAEDLEGGTIRYKIVVPRYHSELTRARTRSTSCGILETTSKRVNAEVVPILGQ